MPEPLNIFVSYSRLDKKWLDELQVHLKPLMREGQVNLWDDTRIKAGARWEDEIKQALDAAHVAILLISHYFLASDFILDEELQPLLKTAEEKGLVILPLIVGHSRFQQTKSLSVFQAVNDPDKPLSRLPKWKRNEILVQLTGRIDAVVEHRRRQREAEQARFVERLEDANSLEEAPVVQKPEPEAAAEGSEPGAVEMEGSEVVAVEEPRAEAPINAPEPSAVGADTVKVEGADEEPVVEQSMEQPARAPEAPLEEEAASPEETLLADKVQEKKQAPDREEEDKNTPRFARWIKEPKRHALVVGAVVIAVILVFVVWGNDLLRDRSQREGSPTEVLKVPHKYAPPIKKPGEYGPDIVPVGEDERNAPRWIVYSDRDDNPTYSLPGGALIHNRLGFLDQFYVVEERGNYVRLVQDDNLDRRQLSSSAVDFGWIHKERLLLWRQCLISERGKINQKAMILNTISHLKRVREGDESKLVEFRKNPDEAGPLTGITSRLYEIYYVYKETPEMVLLGKMPRLPRRKEDRRAAIVGWAPRSQLVFWDHRIALEPNWEPDAVAERRAGRPVQIFADEAAAQRYSQGETQLALWAGDPLSERPNGYKRHMRFPVLEYESIRIGLPLYEVGIMASLGGVDDELANIQEKTELELARRRNINVVFIVDATTSMRAYFRPIVEAIGQTMDQLKGAPNTFRFGAAVYRDYAEGSLLFERQPLGSDADVKQFFSRQQAYDALDTDWPAAVYYGMRGALRGVNLPADETNVCVVIGGVGNHYRDDTSQVPENEVIRLLARWKCHLLAVQAHHGREFTHYEFAEQMKRLALEAARQLQPAVEMSGAEEPAWTTSQGMYRLENTQYGGWVTGASPGQPLSTDTLKQTIVLFLDYVDQLNTTIIQAIAQVVEGGETVEKVIEELERQASENWFDEIIQFESAIYDVLESAGAALKQIQLARQGNYHLYTLGVAPMYVEGQEHPLFKRVLLFSQEELALLVASIEQLADVKSSSRARQRQLMVQVWTRLLKSYLGESNTSWQTLSMEEIQAQVFGLPGGTRPLLRNLRLEDIEDPSRFTDEEFGYYLESLGYASVELARILNANFAAHPYHFRSHEESYYWIDEEIIP